MPAPIIAAMPILPLPALLLITVKFEGLLAARNRSINAWINSIGVSDPPKPPIIRAALTVIQDTACPRDGRDLSI